MIPSRPFTAIPVASTQPSEIVKWLVRDATSPNSNAFDVHLLAGHSLHFVDKKPEFLEVLKSAPLVIPDGKWLEILTRNQPFPLHQLRGEDLFLQVCDQGREKSLRHFFVGSTDEKLGRLHSELEARFPGINLVGSFAFPFGELTEEGAADLRDAIADSKAQVVWIGISTPRQDLEAQRIARENKLMVIAVGAAFDFVTGDKVSAPKWMQKAGLEWFFRLVSEPRRLWRRYIIGSVVAILRILRYYRRDQQELKRMLAEQQEESSRGLGV